MKQIFILASFIAGFMLFYGILSQLLGKRIMLSRRLLEIKAKRVSVDQRDEELQKPFYDRALVPFIHWLSIMAGRLAPVKKNSNFERKLLLAGRPLNLNQEEFVAVYYIIMMLFMVLGAVIAILQGRLFLSVLIYAFSGILIGYGMVELGLRYSINQRKEKIRRSLPDVLDLLTVSVEAGLGFDAAISRVVEKSKGPLADEIGETLQEIKMGRQRRDALRDLGARMEVEELQNFVSSVIQADQLGVSIGNVLRSQSAQVRMLRRQAVEARAMRAPIIMLLPMMAFIFPAVFVVLLSPGIIRIVENFIK